MGGLLIPLSIICEEAYTCPSLTRELASWQDLAWLRSLFRSFLLALFLLSRFGEGGSCFDSAIMVYTVRILDTIP
jgi:hypothetical protein